jgi:hypothetical protein
VRTLPEAVMTDRGLMELAASPSVTGLLCWGQGGSKQMVSAMLEQCQFATLTGGQLWI